MGWSTSKVTPEDIMAEYPVGNCYVSGANGEHGQQVIGYKEGICGFLVMTEFVKGPLKGNKGTGGLMDSMVEWGRLSVEEREERHRNAHLYSDSLAIQDIAYEERHRAARRIERGSPMPGDMMDVGIGDWDERPSPQQEESDGIGY